MNKPKAYGCLKYLKNIIWKTFKADLIVYDTTDEDGASFLLVSVDGFQLLKKNIFPRFFFTFNELQGRLMCQK
jgi:hypothetical protein